MTLPTYRELDLSHARRVLVAGDIHGHLEALRVGLEDIGFDASAGDHLVLLGDFLDRGPDVIEILDWLRATPNVHRVRGNHDDLLYCALYGIDRNCAPLTLLKNGGSWIADFMEGCTGSQDALTRLCSEALPHTVVDPRIRELADLINDAPVALRVRSPGGRDLGFVHGDVPTDSWSALVAGLTTGTADEQIQFADTCMWGRKRFDSYKRAAVFEALDGFDCTIQGIHHVFHGHSITRIPVLHSNVSWIDTGAYKTGRLLVVDADAWIADHQHFATLAAA